ncbi:regulatory protein, luxR family [Mycolicibacterium rutilum]|uniref:Regulatory protein, luxR family n=1 Tax=Mycolicibacterium rutilum TaxID=370526 RepID=A0A1H6KN59_MYCRU|nr:helix-turn-helix transcriptional regulator [Mycolicibacterium rutilum]SEH76971.1 regulatory protein, luxR family [Mycolicibacterium rutilum]
MIGRDNELEVITAAATALAERGCALVVEGEPGIGKTTLLAAAAGWAKCQGFTVLSCAGVQSQAAVGYAGLHELVHPILNSADALPEHQRAALLAALGLAEAGVPNPLLIGVATLGLVEEAAATRPMLLVIDDAQWLDDSTLHVVTFIGRRIANTPVMMLCAARPRIDGESSQLSSLPHLQLDALDIATSRLLMEEALAGVDGHGLSALTQRRVLTEAAGNPLAIAELTKALLAGGEEQRNPPLTPLPTTRRIERAFLEQLHGVPEPSRRMLGLIAAGGDTAMAELADAARHVGLSDADLDPLERCGLITVVAGSLQVRHPLIRSVAYRATPLTQRSAFHHALADATTDAMRAAWHRSAAAYGPDEGVAADLETAAQAAQLRGANAEAARAWRRAAALSPSANDRIRCLVSAIEPAYRAGLTAEAIDILDEAEPLAIDLGHQFDLAFARFTLAVTTGVTAPPVEDLVALADRFGSHGELDTHIRLLAAAAAQCRMHGLDERDRDLIAERLHQVEHLDHPAVEVALATLEDTKYARQFRCRAATLQDALSDDLTALMSMGLAAESASDLATARSCWDGSIKVARRTGAPAIECEALRGSARSQIIAGQLTEAAVSAHNAFRIATDADLGLSMGAAAALLARIQAWQGDTKSAQQSLATAQQNLPSDTPLLWLDDLAWASGLLALTTHDSERAFTELSQMNRDRSSRRWAIADLTEAAVASGHTRVICQLVDEIDTEASALGSPHIVMLVHRSRALIAGTEKHAEHHFHAALDIEDAEAQAPLEYARTQMSYGEWLRRQRRIIDARTQLAAALRVFEHRGAAPWAQRTRGELRAAGVQMPGAASAIDVLTTKLSPQELQIARLAAAGLTNRQIADQIYISHRTVAAHLYKIFPKLGITRRAQLRDAIELDNATPAGE